MQSTHVHPISRWFILILSSHLCLGLPSGLLQDSPPKPSLLKLIRATCPAYFILDFITRTIVCEQYRSFSFSLWPTVPCYLFFHCHSTSVTWQHYYGCGFCTFFHILWTALCPRSLVAQLVTFMNFVQEIHGSKNHWDFRSLRCRCMQLLVQ
jgi:hypothetical protein